MPAAKTAGSGKSTGKTFLIECIGIHWTQMLLITQFQIYIRVLKVAARVVLWRPLLVNPSTVSCNGFPGNSETTCLVMYCLWWGVVDLHGVSPLEKAATAGRGSIVGRIEEEEKRAGRTMESSRINVANLLDWFPAACCHRRCSGCSSVAARVRRCTPCCCHCRCCRWRRSQAPEEAPPTRRRQCLRWAASRCQA